MEQASEFEVLDMESNVSVQTRGKAWSFDREWECALFDDARTAADFVVEHDIKNRMPATLGITYLVVLVHVHISSNTGAAYVQMNGYLQSSRQLGVSALRQWFPEEEGINLSVVKGGLCGNFSYESDMKKTSPWITYAVIGELRLNNSGKRQVIFRENFRPPHNVRNIFVETLNLFCCIAIIRFHV
jgi:hypothetical protein